MQKLVSLAVAAGAVVVGARSAQAEPGWCGGARFEDYRVSDINDNDAGDAVAAIAMATCSPNDEARAQHAELERARAAWSAKLYMTDADWADAVALAKARQGHNDIKLDFSTKSFAEFSPVDQYQAIEEHWSNSADYFYVADALEPVLDQGGRLALIQRCVLDTELFAGDKVVTWALCQPDIEKFDPAKLSAELRADTGHGGDAKMVLRLHAFALQPGLKDHAAAIEKDWKHDDAYKKVFEVAAKARGEWAQLMNGQQKLLELAMQMDSGAFFQSRKQFEGCQDKTQQALAAALATVPAKSFAKMFDERDDPFKGFAHDAAPVLAKQPVFHLAAAAYAECQPKSPTGDFLGAVIQLSPAQRGPRGFAAGKIGAANIELDDLKAKLIFPGIYGPAYARSGAAISSAGGVVASITPGKTTETVEIKLEKLLVKQLDCVQEHIGRHIAQIRSDGTVDYERICDKTAMVTHDHTWAPMKVSAKTAKTVKPGMRISITYGEKVADVIAIWPNKAAQQPSVMLGANVK